MSLNTQQNIKCPACNLMQEITVWDSITAKDSPDLKKDLLSGKINMFRCSSCSHFGLIPTPMLYHDEEKKLMISFTPCNDSNLKNRLYENVCETSKSSGELEAYEEYNLRFVSEYNALLEKILIFDSQLNDKAIEVIKVIILSQEPEKQEQRMCLFGKKDGDELEFMIQDTKENMVYTSKVPLDTYNTIWQQLRQSGVKPYSFGWEMVDSDYAMKLINGINNV